MAEGETGSANKETSFLSELIGSKPVTVIPGIEQVHANKLRGKGIRKVNILYYPLRSYIISYSRILDRTNVSLSHCCIQ